MDWSAGQNPNNLLAFLGQKVVNSTDDYRKIAAELERLRVEGYFTHWKMEIGPSGDANVPLLLKVYLERKNG